MKLIPTNVMYKNARFWIETEDDNLKKDIEYHTEIGSRLLLEYRPNLPKKDEINLDKKKEKVKVE